MSTLRNATIRLAYQNPKLRPVLLPLLFGKEAGEVIDLDEYRRRLQMLRSPLPETPEDFDEAVDYAAMVSLLRRLQTGDKVTITYRESKRGGIVKTHRVVQKSWQELRTEVPSGFKSPTVYLQPKVVGRFKTGMIADYGNGSVVWQPTSLTPIATVLSLKRV